MEKLITPIGLFGLFYLIAGTVLNINMYLTRAWPTGIFFVSMFLGSVYIALSYLKWNLKYKYLIQVLGVVPLILIFWPRVENGGAGKINVNASAKVEILDGDIIFQTSRSSQSIAIQLATKSKYSHMGIVYQTNGKYFVYEAIQPVKSTPLDQWIKRGEQSHYVIKRLKNRDTILTNEKSTKDEGIGRKVQREGL